MERGKTSCWMENCVIWPFNIKKILDPRLWLWMNKPTKVLFQNPVKNLGWPIISGWYEALMHNWVPHQNLLIKIVSRPETKLWGKLWYLQTMSRNNWTTFKVVKWLGKVPKWAPWAKRSTMTKIMELLENAGKPMIKYFAIELIQTHVLRLPRNIFGVFVADRCFVE